MASTIPQFTPALVGLLLAAVGLGAAAGWWVSQQFRLWRRDETDLSGEFARLYAGGITHYVAGRRDQAIEDLTRAAGLRTDVIGLYLVLGDLYRQKGKFDRAIRVHSGLLTRQELTPGERAQVHASLGEDYRTAGMVDRSREAFGKALELDPRNLAALHALARACVEERRWEQALGHEEQILRHDRTRKQRPLAFLYNEIGREKLTQGEDRAAMRHFQKAIAVDERTWPAHIFLGDLYYKEGDLKRALDHWEKVVEMNPRQLHLVFDRLENGYGETGGERSIGDLCRHVAQQDPRDWRARVLLARLDASRGDYESAYRYLLEAADLFPESLTVGHELWKLTLSRGLNRAAVDRYLDRLKGVNEFVDPFVCGICRHRSMEYLWRCPQCFAWDTFAEERARSEA